MYTTEIKVRLTAQDLEKVIRCYHFREKDRKTMENLYQAAVPLVQAKAYYLWKQKNSVISYEEYAVVFLTLGDGMDRLQELYLEKKCLSEAYMLECISLELLSKAYEEFVKQVQRETGKWAVKIDFLGDTYPIELLPELYEEFGNMEIHYNEKLVLSPAKSVAFLLPVTGEETKNPCHICENCGNENCLFRQEKREQNVAAANTYGYQRIFGGKG